MLLICCFSPTQITETHRNIQITVNRALVKTHTQILKFRMVPFKLGVVMMVLVGSLWSSRVINKGSQIKCQSKEREFTHKQTHKHNPTHRLTQTHTQTLQQ